MLIYKNTYPFLAKQIQNSRSSTIHVNIKGIATARAITES